MIVLAAVLLWSGAGAWRIEDPAPQESEARLRAGQEKLKAGDYQGAVPEFERCLELNPDEYNARFGLGVCAWEKEDFSRARDHFRAVVERVERLHPGTPLLGVHQKLLACALLLEDFDAAVGEASRLIDLEPRGEYYYDRALALVRKGNFAGALEDCSRALREETSLIKARVLRAFTLLSVGRAADALAEFATVIEQKPTDRRGYLGRAWALYSLERYGEAGADLEEAWNKNRGQGSDAEDQAATTALGWLVERRLGHRDQALGRVKRYRASLKELGVDAARSHLLGLPLYLAGDLSESELLKASESARARKTQARCETWFIVAERRLLEGDASGAREAFRACIDTGARGTLEYEMALRRRNELGR